MISYLSLTGEATTTLSPICIAFDGEASEQHSKELVSEWTSLSEMNAANARKRRITIDLEKQLSSSCASL